jgi:signal transduction histidine kinase
VTTSSLALLERDVLTVIVRDEPISHALELLVTRLEQHAAPGTIGSILLATPEGRLRHGAAPRLPAAYTATIDGSAVGEGQGSCGTAAWRRQTVVVTDIATDPLWESYRPIALAHGLRACWSVPILALDGDCLGTFAFYYREPRQPTAEDLAVIQSAATLAGIVLERQRLEESRRALMQELRETVQFAELFAGILGHDLRNPLNTLAVGTQLLQSRVKDPSAARVLERMQSSHKRMSRMVDQLLDLTRARAQRSMPMQRTALDLAELVKSVVDEMRLAFPTRAVELHTDGDGRGEWDPDRLGQLVSNLVGNALHHGEASSGIRVHVDGRSPREVVLRTHNRGTIPAEQLETLFDPFRRGANRGTHDGLGLGLTIAKLIVEGHGGRLIAESDASGTTFHAVLPRAA